MDSRGQLDEKKSKEQVVELLNQAALASDPDEKITCLTKVQDTILHLGPELLDSFLDEVLAFQNDRSQEVRRTIVGFLEEACKQDPDVFPKVAVNLSYLLRDEAVAVQKRVIQGLTHLYPVILRWLSRARSISKQMSSAWDWLIRMKGDVIKWLDHDNDGVRTLAIKFYEMLIIAQTYREEDSTSKESDVSLDIVPLTLTIARPRKLEEEAKKLLDDLIKFHGSAHISSANLLACMGSLSLIARARPTFMGQVVNAMEMLHANLPPTLTKSQVSSVRKHLKLQFLNLLKHPASMDYMANITTLLTDLGATQSEVERNLPKPSDIQRRKQKVPPTPKRLKPEFDEDDDDFQMPKPKAKKALDPMDYTQRYVKERLTVQVAADLVMSAMVHMPLTMPPHFSSSYTPIAAAGTEGQIMHVARLLAAQMTAAGIGVNPPKEIEQESSNWEDEDEDPKSSNMSSVGSVISGIGGTRSSLGHLVPAGGILPARTVKSMKLSEITKPLSAESKTKMVAGSILRIYKGEKLLLNVGASNVRNTLLAKMAASYPEMMHDSLIAYISEDLRVRLDLAMSWLYELYCTIMGFYSHSNPTSRSFDAYTNVFGRIAGTLVVRNDLKDRDQLLTRLYLEAPMLPEGGVDFLRRQALSESCSQASIDLLKQLVVYRPARQINYFNALLELCTNSDVKVRTRALAAVMELYDRGEMRQVTEDYARMYLNFLSLKEPPEIVLGEEGVKSEWNEDLARSCLFLYMALMEKDLQLIQDLARIFVKAVSDVKRAILKMLDQPLKGMDMESPHLFRLLDTCPEGSETFITKVLHVVTDKAPPSTQLVEKVRDVYSHRSADVRFLIPILSALHKFEILNVLPKLVRLNQAAVKEVFNRLLANPVDGLSGPLTPVELLVNLHTIDTSKCDVKSLMKAITICIEDQDTFTAEVIAIVINQLIEQPTMPTLLMRTILQALGLHPKLTGFVVNILQKLLVKQVWKKKVLWEGFVKCCEKTQPQSFSILLQLAPQQIGEALSMCPALREPMYAHVMQFPESQRAHIPNSVMMMLYGAPISESLHVKDEHYQYQVKTENQEYEEVAEVQQSMFKPRMHHYESDLSVPGEEPPGT